MQVSSICSPFIYFKNRTCPLQLTRHSFSNASVVESNAHGRLNLLPLYYSLCPRRRYGVVYASASASASGSGNEGGLERFTERAIKAIIYSQREAKAVGRDMVFTQHLLLGLIAEEEEHHHYQGFLGSGITLQVARDAVRSIWHHTSSSSSSSSSVALPFSISTKRVLGAALHYSRTMAHHFIAPEHIFIALFTVDDGTAARLLNR